jgi:hypothetical protein
MIVEDAAVAALARVAVRDGILGLLEDIGLSYS